MANHFVLTNQLSRTLARLNCSHGLAERVVIMSRRSSTSHYKLLVQSSCSSSARPTASLHKRTATQRSLLTQSTNNRGAAALRLEAGVNVRNAVDAVPLPTPQALRTLFVASAIPMVGFGFMDNVVMIQAGQYIDSTLGVTLGLATMTAAAAGQVVSDVSGVLFGGTLEGFLTRMSLIQAPALTTAQRQLPICRNVAMAGAVLGIIFGCALGASTLLLVDLEARDRIQHARQLQDILTDMIADNKTTITNDATAASTTIPCQSCTIHLAAAHDKFTVDNTTAVSGKTRLAFMEDAAPHAVVHTCAQTQQVLVEEHSLYAPVVLSNGQLLAVLEFQANQTFAEHHVTTVKVMARHLAIVLKHLVE